MILKTRKILFESEFVNPEFCFMKNFTFLILIALFSLTAFAQKPKPKPLPIKKPSQTAPLNAASEKEQFEKALAIETPIERIAALQKFLNDFPKTSERHRALELIVSARAQIAEEKLRLSETEEGVKFFVLAVSEAPKPISEELFAKVILQLPTNLFFRNQPKAALEVARIIEEKAEGNPRQLLALATFYLGTENADEAKRLAEKVISVANSNAVVSTDANANATTSTATTNPASVMLPVESQIAAFQTLGMANRLNFDLEAAANAYAKALELKTDSLVSKRSLAEMKRATGKTEEAIALYREILEKDAADTGSQTGLVLSLFDADKQTEAETELGKALGSNPSNFFLLVGAAYWYAAHRMADKALEYAQKAVTLEPRYTWGQIALARALMLQRKPLEAEKALLTARQFGNFPTLDYELATVRAASGFYEEAAADLRRSFAVTKDGNVETNLGYRVRKEAKSFVELLALERRASIFEMTAADDLENAARMKSLLNFSQKINAKELPSETEITEAVDEFTNGATDDQTKTHRQLYAASRLLQKRIALPKILELTQAAVKGVDASLEVAAPSAAVLADELYETRQSAMSRGQLVVVPEIPRPTLLNIMRGRIEEIAGWTLYYQEKPQEAGIRLKRAVGILPEKSAWWRSSMWRLGAAFEAGGKPNEALEAYIKSYLSGEPDVTRRTVIEALYQKINGTTEGLDEKIGTKPKPTVSYLIKQTEPAKETVAKIETSPSPTTAENSTTNTSGVPRVVVTSNLPLPETSPSTTPSPTIETTPTPELKTETAPTPTLTGVKTEPTPETPQTIAKVETTPETQPPPPQPSPSSSPVETTSTPSPATTTPEIKTESLPKPVAPNEVKTEKTVVEITDPLEKKSTETKPLTNQTPTADKSLFDPIVINVPKPEAVKLKTETNAETKPVATPTPVKTEEPNLDLQAKTTTQQTKPDPIASGEDRPRVIVTENYPTATTSENTPCSLVTGQTNISLLNNGGKLGVLVGYAGDGFTDTSDISKITAVSSSPNDISIEFEPDIGKQSNRAFFVIKSISQKTGIFTVTFNSPCGKKELQVKVR